MSHSAYVVLDVEYPIEPDVFNYQDFTIKNDGILEKDVSCIHPDSNLLWYIMNGDVENFNKRYDYEFVELTYKRNIKGENPISDIVSIESGTYTFIYVQTVGYIGECETSAKIVFTPSDNS
jgi:hypothetical protein